VPDVKALAIKQPGNSLAVWLAAHHPDIFLAIYKRAQANALAARARSDGLGGLGQGFDEPSLQTITVDTDFAPSTWLTDATASGASLLDSIGSGVTSAGSTVGSTITNAGSSILGALGSVGSFLASPPGVNTLTGLVKTYFQTQGQVANAQAQQAVLQAQIARVATNQPAAPITYTTDQHGNPVPVYATQTPQGTVYQPLSQQGIQSLTPSGLSVFFSQYGLYIALAAAAVWGMTALARR
jgi:hypothetical protein